MELSDLLLLAVSDVDEHQVEAMRWGTRKPRMSMGMMVSRKPKIFSIISIKHKMFQLLPQLLLCSQTEVYSTSFCRPGTCNVSACGKLLFSGTFKQQTKLYFRHMLQHAGRCDSLHTQTS
jgi:hypothetical protein